MAPHTKKCCVYVRHHPPASSVRDHASTKKASRECPEGIPQLWRQELAGRGCATASFRPWRGRSGSWRSARFETQQTRTAVAPCETPEARKTAGKKTPCYPSRHVSPLLGDIPLPAKSLRADLRGSAGDHEPEGEHDLPHAAAVEEPQQHLRVREICRRGSTVPTAPEHLERSSLIE